MDYEGDNVQITFPKGLPSFINFNEDQRMLNIEVGGINKNIAGSYSVLVMLKDDLGASRN